MRPTPLYIRGPNDEAERRYRELTRAFDDAEAWYNLGEAFHGNPYRAAPRARVPSRSNVPRPVGGSLDVRGHLLQLALQTGSATLRRLHGHVRAGYGPDEPQGRIYAVLRARPGRHRGAALAAITRVPGPDLLPGRSIATLTADFALAAPRRLRSPAAPRGGARPGPSGRAPAGPGSVGAARDEIDTLARPDAALAEQLDAYYGPALGPDAGG